MTSTGNATRTAIVTGAARGIGRGIAERLAKDGLDVAVADLPGMSEELSEVAAGIEKTGRRASPCTPT
ncbi:SDR family NAD(P)-dependent oxidoreductase [Streptomyces sp. M19]